MIDRRQFLTVLSATALGGAESPDSRQATGFKIGETTPTGAVVWTRHTRAAVRLADGIVRVGFGPKARPVTPEEDVNAFQGACPGAEGLIRVAWEPVSGRGRRRRTGWIEVGPDTDFTHQFRLEGLEPATSYRLAVETRPARGAREAAPLTGKFRTAPRPDAAAPVRLALLSCQKYCRMDRGDGFWIYDSIQQWDPDALLGCGDNVYYDSEDPIASNARAARYHWHRMFSLGTLTSCLRNVAGYWQKDDHDLYADDCWPGRTVDKMGDLDFEQGQRIFREQTPAPPPGQPMYRTFRWGADLEIWLPEARDYRAPNDAPDGPGKSLWGEEQKRWLQRTLEASPAAWKLIVNPNPMVGPDHTRKNDNHANPAFAHESREFRHWLKEHASGRVILMNGDRHWQYHSVDPETGVHEFGCGPASDAHAVSPSEGHDPKFHRFLRVAGGFVAISLDPERPDQHLVLEHRDVKGAVAYRQVFARPS